MSKFDARRLEIVDAAAHLFAIKGYDGTSISDLTDAVGLGRGALYHYIVSKEDLLIEIANRGMVPLLEKAKRITQLDATGALKLRLLSEMFLTVQFELYEHAVVVVAEHRQFTGEQFANYRESEAAFEVIVEDTLMQGRDDGSLAFENVLAARQLFIGLHTSTVRWLNVDGPLSAAELSRLYCDMLLSGIGTRQESDSNEIGNIIEAEIGPVVPSTRLPGRYSS